MKKNSRPHEPAKNHPNEFKAGTDERVYQSQKNSKGVSTWKLDPSLLSVSAKDMINSINRDENEVLFEPKETPNGYLWVEQTETKNKYHNRWVDKENGKRYEYMFLNAKKFEWSIINVNNKWYKPIKNSKDIYIWRELKVKRKYTEQWTNKSGYLIIIDPGTYIDKIQEKKFKATKGKWEAFVEIVGDCTKSLHTCIPGQDLSKCKIESLGDVGVDSGTAGIFDYEYLPDDPDDPDDGTNYLTDFSGYVKSFPFGVASLTGWGDGFYSIKGYKYRNKIVGVTITFM